MNDIDNQLSPKYYLFYKIEIGLLVFSIVSLLFIPWLHSIARYAFWSSLFLLTVTFLIRGFSFFVPFDIRTTKKKLRWYIGANTTLFIYPITLFLCLYPISLTLAQLIKVMVIVHLLFILFFFTSHPRSFFIKEILRFLSIMGITFICYTYSYNLFCYLYQVSPNSEIAKHYQLLEHFEKSKNRDTQEQTYKHLKQLIAEHDK